ncbi:hypothetical protein DPMN_174015 [Dreissena polymorpha]|uniref:Uncharacterized protein n=1 Tax=Dreissena polymorpha TaxID=45954 RepID=A0A9D4E3Z1_DREPO|nr:hypothetical protein DPMN_174015 [Dreissena polymorpha]
MAAFSSSITEKGSDSEIAFWCSTCEEGGTCVEAEFYCEKCVKCYCGKCIKPHSELFTTHTAYGKGDMEFWPFQRP